MIQIKIIFIVFLIFSQNVQVIVAKSSIQKRNNDETMQVIKQVLLQLSKKYKTDKSEQQSNEVITKLMQISTGKMIVYLGPRIIEIIEKLLDILQSGNISYEEINNWKYDHGFNLLGISAGALLGYKLCSLFSITNPAFKVTAMIGLSFLGDQTIDFYKSMKQSENELTFEELQSILKLDEELTPKIIQFIKENYLQITTFYINKIL